MMCFFRSFYWLLLGVIILPAAVCAQAKKTYMVEAESFQFLGGWVVEPAAGAQVSGNKIARVYAGKNAVADALTVIDVEAPGSYTVWVNSPDFPTNMPGTRTFRLLVNDQVLPPVGKHGKEGYHWEKIADVSLDRGQQVLRLRDMITFGRCDAIILSSAEGFDPNNSSLPELQKNLVAPVMVKTNTQAVVSNIPAVITAAAPVVASVMGNNLRLSFVQDLLDPGKRLLAKTDILQNGEWVNMNAFAPDHKVYLITAKDPRITYSTFFPSWGNTTGTETITVEGKDYQVSDADNVLNPFYSGSLKEAVAQEARVLDRHTIEVMYQTADGTAIKGRWTIGDKTNHLAVNLRLIAPQAGSYSFAIAAFQPLPQEKVTNVQMPPMFQYRRLSKQAKMLTSAMMPQPLSIVETRLSSGAFSTFAAPDIHAFPADDWGRGTTAPYGFTLKNEKNEVQPVVFSPVPGLASSFFKAGDVVERNFVIGALTAGWGTALEYISNNISQVKDYRKQQASLTDAAFNIIDLIKNDDAAGWDASLKSFYDIEGDPKTAPTVVHASPLTLVSTAVLTRDENFYLTRALPTIEYTLSRSGFRWATDLVPGSFNTTRKTLLLNPLTSQFTTAYYEGLYSLLGKSNPWITALALPGNNIRNTIGYAVVTHPWTQMLAAYRLTNEKRWLDQATAGADNFVARLVYMNSPTPLTKNPFYNATFYANWWELLDLYEITKDDKYVKAAEASAFQTIAGIRSYPLVKDTLQTIHKGNTFEGNTRLWWKGKKLYRLGYPHMAGDAPEKQVPQGLVSPVGLGFEQPETYFELQNTVRPVYMSSWAPNLLRLYQHTRRPLFNTYARNAVIGRFSNYPGYYGSGFTDIPLQKDFPYKGPDVSTIYYHHIPAHLSFTLDYLVTEASERSNGQVSFPYSKQDAFVWFNNRVYGTGAGSVYDDKQVKLWLKEDLVTLNTPEVNYVTGLSGDRFWILLSSEADKPLTVSVTLGKDVDRLPGSGASVYKGIKAKKNALKIDGNTIQVPLDAKGFAAISVPIVARPPETVLAPVRSGMKVIDAGEPWGKLFTFRIRSPFGWDSIYGFAETAPIQGAEATVSLGENNIRKAAYPFEWSFLKIDPKEKVTLKIKLSSNGTTREETVVLEGNQ